MALSTCRECGKEVSTEAKSCPHCGAPRPADQDWKGTGYEWKSAQTYFGYPLVHIAYGKDQHGKRRVARGIIAIGQFGVGLITVAQFGFGLVFGFGQFIIAPLALAQFAGAVLVGVGQFATGYIAIGQFVLAYYGLGQAGIAKYLWSPKRKDVQAVTFFRSLLERARPYLQF